MEGREGFCLEIEPFANLRAGDEDLDDAWINGKFTQFSRWLGMPTKGYEKDILWPLRKMKKENTKLLGSETSRSKQGPNLSLHDRELRRLEWSMNDNGSKKGKGGSILNLRIKILS